VFGDDVDNVRKTPTQMGSLTNYSAVAPGGYHACSVRDELLSCWGLNTDGELADGTFLTRSTPVLVVF
jgi:hypothetical protein